MIPIGCINNPEKGSYFCTNHKNVDPQLRFMYGEKLYKCRLSQIKLKQNSKLANLNEIKIYDRFLTEKNEYYFLVDYNDKQPFWASEKQLAEKLTEFSPSNDSEYIFFSKKKKNIVEKCQNKTKTEGIFLSVYNCNVIASYREIFNCECLSYAATFCLDTMDHMNYIPDYVVYDMGCKLRKYIWNDNNIKNLSERLIKLREKTILVDRFHFKKHSKDDTFCVENCDADHFEEMKNVNTSSCEEINFWLSQYKHIHKHIGKIRQKFFLFIIFDEFNFSSLLMKLKRNDEKI